MLCLKADVDDTMWTENSMIHVSPVFWTVFFYTLDIDANKRKRLK